MPKSQSVRALVESFVEQIAAAIDSDAKARIAATLDRMYSGSPGPGHSIGSKGKVGRPPQERRSVSPAARRARKLQGQYLGALRGLTGRKRNKVKAIAKTKGIAKAVAAAHALVKEG